MKNRSPNRKSKVAVIIGGGPAGLTAAYELLKKSDIKPIVIEKDDILGGISRTVDYKGNKIDIGGHRFFSKSDEIIDWWLNILPMEVKKEEKKTVEINYKGAKNSLKNDSVSKEDTDDKNKQNKKDVMLIRERRSHILYEKKYYKYPLELNLKTLKKLGLVKTTRILITYSKVLLFPKRDVKNLEEFFISRFGTELYKTFFKSYTEKVWGTECKNISSEWGEQRIKTLELKKAILDGVKSFYRKLYPHSKSYKEDIKQKKKERSLIERFLYPKHGPGHLWSRVGDLIKESGGEVLKNFEVNEIIFKGDKVSKVIASNYDRKSKEFECDYCFSTMPMNELVKSFKGVKVPKYVKNVSSNLQYRDFITVGVLIEKEVFMRGEKCDDNWIYVHDSKVNVGRIQVFNNWSPDLVSDYERYYWIGLEYFCSVGDGLWNLTEKELKDLAKQELVSLGLIKDINDVKDSCVARMLKAYPVYAGVYEKFYKLRDYVDKIPNLFLIGRNGMHRYNNQDHSMLTAIQAVDNVIKGVEDKSNLWQIQGD